MDDQKIEYILLSKLVLWTENPRDKIDSKANDQDIADLALSDLRGKWSLSKLAKEMGDQYDFSELPTVVYHNATPVVYDGNRRIILGKLKLNLINNTSTKDFNIPNFPNKIPCNVCTKSVALNNILRKHGDSGSWSPLERDIFLNKHMNYPKSNFLLLEENTGLISKNPHLNQRFVKEEVFKDETLASLGFHFKDEVLYVKHDDEEANSILMDISQKISDKQLSTRSNRGDVIEVLDKNSRDIIKKNNSKPARPISIETFNQTEKNKTNSEKHSRRVSSKELPLFGGKLSLKTGELNNLYRDISEIYQLYADNKVTFSKSFIGLVRMSLRLLAEMAARDNNVSLDSYFKIYFGKAKQLLDSDLKTTLSTNNVNESTIIQLLHTGAHSYSASLSKDQTIAISIILGKAISLTHGKK